MIASQVAFDAVHPNVQFIPVNPFAVGGYINGARSDFIWTPEDWAKFPHSYHIQINVTGELGRGNCLDVENGDATPANIGPWIVSNKAKTDPLLIYCNRNNLVACVAARNAVKDIKFAFMWEATLDGTISDRAMTQFTQTKLPSGTAVTDVSLITNQTLLSQMAAHLG